MFRHKCSYYTLTDKIILLETTSTRQTSTVRGYNNEDKNTKKNLTLGVVFFLSPLIFSEYKFSISLMTMQSDPD